MARITMRNSQKATFAEVFEVYISAVTARGVKDKTIATYKRRQFLKKMSFHQRLNASIRRTMNNSNWIFDHM